MARNSLSAQLDGELSPLEQEALEAHLAGCGPCTTHQAALARLHRRVRLRPADAVPDLSAQVLAALPPPRRRLRQAVPALDWRRAALLVVAATQLLLALPLLLGLEPGASSHVGRELGAFSAAFAAGLLVVVWQPQRSTGLLPAAAALAVAMVLGGVADLVAGDATVVAESHHVLELLGLGLLAAVARTTAGPVSARLATA